VRFPRGLTPWLSELAAHNERAWFQAHKAEYDALVREPALAFLRDLASPMAALAPQIRVDERALFRIQRDTRFSRDKTPYKTHVGLHLRHILARDVHAPGFYLHLAPMGADGPAAAEGEPSSGCWFGAGLWQPDGPTTRRIRAHLLAHPDAWRARLDRLAQRGLRVDGPRLVRPPPGVDAAHPLVDALRLKSFVAVAPLDPADLTDGDAVATFLARCADAIPLVEGLCEALDLPW
jgi:uncharacterized protein (TIGR02453 family)